MHPLLCEINLALFEKLGPGPDPGQGGDLNPALTGPAAWAHAGPRAQESSVSLKQKTSLEHPSHTPGLG